MFRASQSWSTRCLTGLLVMALLLSLVPISASAVSSIGLSYSQPSVGRGSLKLYWDSAPNVEFYAYSVRDLTTGESICSNERTSRTSASVSWTWENNHSYRIWAGACCTGNDPDNTSTWDYTGMDSFTVVGCPHTNTETAWDTTNHDVSYKSISDYEHKITGYEYEYCTKCFERIGKSHKVTETQAHVFDSDGDCTICNYRHSCQHKNTELVIASGFPSYKSCNDKEHTCTILYDRVCANATCGKVVKLGDTRTTEDQPHRFNSSGRCKDCGYQKSYEKLQVSVSRSQSEAYAGSSISASASVSGGDGQYKCGWEVTCNGQTVSQTDMGMGAYYSYTASTVGQYVFTVTVTDGQGSRVDASSQSITVKAKPCEHPTYAVQWTADPRSCKSISDSEHTTTGYQYKYCTVCGVQISEKFKATETEPHQFDAAGDCLSCDYRHSCQHKDTTLVIASGFPSYKSCNAKEHTCTTLYDRVCANATCGKVVKLGDTRTTEDQPHRFNSSGRCKDCGYQKSYEKLQLGVSRFKAEAYVGDTIGASASASGGDGQYNYEWQISLNGQIIDTFAGGRDDSYTITASSAGQYVFTATVTDGQGSCKTASSSAITVKAKACEHTSYTDVPGTSKYTQISDAKHKKTTLMRRVCDSCKKTLNEYNKEVSESHHFSNGSCKECGAADPNAVCKHKNATNQFAYADITGQGNTQQHIVTDTYKVVCNDCGITIRTYETRRMADHNFNSDGVCNCGYAKPNTCDHANRKTTPLRVTGYVDKGSVGHEKTSLVRVECADCGIVLSAENTVTVVENHDFTYNNTCICGSQHVHDFNEGTRISGPTYSKLDDTQHSVTEVYRKTCKTCGYQTAEIKTRQEKHNLTKFVRMDKYHDPSRKYAHIVIRSCSDCGAEAPYGYDTYKYCTLCFPTPAPTAAETVSSVTADICKATGKHSWGNEYKLSAHPHSIAYTCTRCGIEYVTSKVSYDENCCECAGHLFDGDDYSKCLRCGQVFQCSHEGKYTFSIHPHIHAYWECQIDKIRIELDDEFQANGRKLSDCPECFPQQINKDNILDAVERASLAYDSRELIEEAKRQMGSTDKVDIEFDNDNIIKKATVSKTEYPGIYRVDMQYEGSDSSGVKYASGLRITQPSGFFDSLFGSNTVEGALIDDSFIEVSNTADGALILSISFEGSKEFKDWVFTDGNTKANADGVHQGFANVAQEYLRTIFNGDYTVNCTINGVTKEYRLDQVLSEINSSSNGHIQISGHSLGGAAAQCMAYYLMDEKYGYAIDKEKMEVYTFASPIPFTYEALNDEKYRGMHVYNFINVHDAVPDVGVSISSLLTNGTAEELANLYYNLKNNPTYNGGMSAVGTNMGTNIYINSEELSSLKDNSIIDNHLLNTTYKPLIDAYVQDNISFYELDTDIFYSDYYKLDSQEAYRKNLEIIDKITKVLKTTKKVLKLSGI